MKYYEKEKIKALPVQDAVGKVLLHDITEIVPDLFKGPTFRKGHVITPADVEKLLDLGKKNIYVAGLDGEIHENDAALRIARAAMGKGLSISDPKEGKVGFSATGLGLLKIDRFQPTRPRTKVMTSFSTLSEASFLIFFKEISSNNFSELVDRSTNSEMILIRSLVSSL